MIRAGGEFDSQTLINMFQRYVAIHALSVQSIRLCPSALSTSWALCDSHIIAAPPARVIIFRYAHLGFVMRLVSVLSGGRV